MKPDLFTKLCLLVITLSFVTMGVAQVLSYRMSKTPRDVRVVRSVPVEIDGSVDVAGSVSIDGTVDVSGSDVDVSGSVSVSGGDIDVGNVTGTVDVNVVKRDGF